MGLSASQARFLALTARKSNVEFQGQQINQARTALSNEVMGLYQKYNNLKVPLPPSINDYTKIKYTVDATEENYELTNWSKITSGPDAGYYNVKLDYWDNIPMAYSNTVKNLLASCEKEDNTYKKLRFTIGQDIFEYDGTSEATIKNSSIKRIDKDYDKYPGLQAIIDAGKFPKDDTVFYSYTRNDVVYYTSESQLNSAFDGNTSYHGAFTFEYQGFREELKSIYAKAVINQESNGRLSSITVVECEDDPDLVDTTHSITTTSKEDQAAYDDATNQYQYKKQVYEREVEKINKQTEKIQTEDKALELKLNQLDTEQKAISTEIESVTTVIKDTIDSVFKTFD